MLFFLLLAFGVRVHDLATLPAGFSGEEIAHIHITEQVRAGSIVVFSPLEQGGIESLFHLLTTAVTKAVGGGFIGYRILPLWISILTLALTYVVAKRLFGVPVGLIALGAMSLNIWMVLLARSVSPVSLASFFVLLVLYTLGQTYHLHRRLEPLPGKTHIFTLFAVVMAVGVYAHYLGLLAIIGIIGFIVYLRRTHQPVLRQMWWHSGYALTLALILCLPYLISVLRNPSISGISFFWYERPVTLGAFIDSVWGTLRAFLGIFGRGDPDPAHNVPGLPLILPLEFVFLLVGLLAAGLRWRQANFGLVLIFFAIGLLPDMWLQEGPDYPALTFVMPLLYMLIGIGVIEAIQFIQRQRDIPAQMAWLQKQRWLGTYPKPLIRLSLLLIGLGFIQNAIHLSNNLFDAWAKRSDTQTTYDMALGYVAVYLNQNAEGAPPLICTSDLSEFDEDEVSQPVPTIVRLEWMLHKTTIPFRVADCRTDFVLINGGKPMRIIFLDTADREALPEAIRFWLALAEPISAENLPAGTLWKLDAEQELADKGGLLELQSQAPETAAYFPRVSNEALVIAPHATRFGGNMTFLGYDFSPIIPNRTYNPGDVLQLVTYWRVEGSLLSNTGIFLRLHDTPQVSPYTELNAFEVQARRLRARDVVVQVGFLSLPEGLRANNYVLTLGVYDEVPTNQLPVYGVDTQTNRGSYLQLGLPFRIVP